MFSGGLPLVATQVQVRRLAAEMARHGRIGLAALRAGMDRKTARQYVRHGYKLFQELKMRSWRTRQDPFAEAWPEIEELLRVDAGLDAKTIFQELQRRRPGDFQDGQLRSLQRAVKRWRGQSGPVREVFFSQEHRPGEAIQSDFTWATEVMVTIAGVPFNHMLHHAVLPFSNWEWATICFSESMAALRDGFQAAMWQLGHVPMFHQTDNSTAATHDLRTGKRGFNQDYLALMDHYRITPRTIAIGKKEQNGDVEAQHRALKRALDQRLRLRGSRDFESRDAYEQWLRTVVVELNRARSTRVAIELDQMRELPEAPLPAFEEEVARVTFGSTIRVGRNSYTVPSRLIGESVRVRVYADRIEAFFAGQPVLATERLSGAGHAKIDYRHVIHSLVKKPFAFRCYRHRDELFPSATFRRAHEVLTEALPERHADLEALRLLKLAADTSEAQVEAILAAFLERSELPRYDAVKTLLRIEVPAVPALEEPPVDLHTYDQLLDAAGRDAATHEIHEAVAKETSG